MCIYIYIYIWWGNWYKCYCYTIIFGVKSNTILIFFCLFINDPFRILAWISNCEGHLLHWLDTNSIYSIQFICTPVVAQQQIVDMSTCLVKWLGSSFTVTIKAGLPQVHGALRSRPSIFRGPQKNNLSCSRLLKK
jgi:hypothetical protein